MMEHDSNLTPKRYQALYQASIADPKVFWAQQARQFITWQKEFTQVMSGSMADANVRWFADGQLNACYNCIDRHLPAHADKTALIWQGDDPKHSQTFSYQDLHDRVCQMANALLQLGVNANDTVCIYLPMIPEALFAMLACARIGAIHTVVFSGFSANALADRLQDANCQILITADISRRNGKTLDLKHAADEALALAPTVKHCLVIRHGTQDIAWHTGRDHDYTQMKPRLANTCPITPRASTDPLFILYTSGSTGKPKGILHSTGGYMVYAAMTYFYVFNHQPDDIFWCSADVGWITGHTYLSYGPLANAATLLMYEGVPTYPDASRLWQIIDQFKVSVFYTAPTLIRLLMREGDAFVKQSSRQSLRLLGSVGEPINPAAWQWFHEVVGDGRCPIVDTWWQTETGGILLVPLPNTGSMKPGAASRPFFGICPSIVDEHDKPITTPNTQGNLIINSPWPGMLEGVYGDEQRFRNTYLNPSPNHYFTGDCATQDDDGDFWIIGRMDDVINVSGHRLGTAEIESAIVAVPDIAEAAVVAIPHDVKGQGLYAFVTPNANSQPSDELAQKIADSLRSIIGPIAKLDALQWTEQLPKTRSGKIMRRILRKIANGDSKDLGDTSTLADSDIITSLINHRV